MFALYSMLTAAAVWCLLLPWELLRLLTGKCNRAELAQRLGWTRTLPVVTKPSLVVHAVSAGEVAAAAPLIRQLAALRPDLAVTLSVGNAAGLAAARKLPVQNVVLLPWDRRWAVGRWLQALSPLAVVVVETEIWPNLFRECRSRAIPLAMVNGRIYPRDLGRYRLIRPFMRRVLEYSALIGVQDEAERQRFLTIGAPASRVAVLGNTKYDLEPQRPSTPSAAAPLLVAGSTHAPEERWLLQAFAALRVRFPDLRLVLAPRDVRRARSVARLARAAGWRVREGEQEWEILVVDRIGELTSWYAAATVVLVGGSLVNRGGHNILEAAARGRPVVVGPHMEHFVEATQRLLEQEALIQVPNPQALEPALGRLLADPALRQAMGARARACVEAGRGAAERYARAVSALLER